MDSTKAFVNILEKRKQHFLQKQHASLNQRRSIVNFDLLNPSNKPEVESGWKTSHMWYLIAIVFVVLVCIAGLVAFIQSRNKEDDQKIVET